MSMEPAVLVVWSKTCRVQGAINPDYIPVDKRVRAIYNRLEKSVLFEIEDGRAAMDLERWVGHPEIPAEFCLDAAKVMVREAETADCNRDLEDRVEQLEAFIGLNEVSRMEAEAEKKKVEEADDIPF